MLRNFRGSSNRHQTVSFTAIQNASGCVYSSGSRSGESLEATGSKDNLSGFPKNERTNSAKGKNKMRTKRALAFRLLLCVGLLMCPTVIALAQGVKTDEYPKFEFFFGYSALGDFTNEIGFTNNLIIEGSYATNNNGFEASVTRNF